jgi:fructoselysine 6-kinase
MDYGERYSEEFIDKTIQYIDLAFFSTNPGEHAIAETLAKRMFTRGPELVVVTMGSEGALAYDGHFTFQPAQKIDVVDTLGAGDTFIATFLSHWIMGKSVADSMALASVAAAHTCSIFGAWEGSQLS